MKFNFKNEAKINLSINKIFFYFSPIISKFSYLNQDLKMKSQENHGRMCIFSYESYPKKNPWKSPFES